MIRRKNGLIIKDKRSVFIGKNVEIGKNVTIYENTRIEGNSVIGDDVIIFPNCYIKDSIIENGANIDSSRLESAFVGEDCQIGPYARLRPNAKICKGAKIGNFVEIKNSTIGERSKVSHLAYVGDADIGKDCNIGCGVIFVNYNGKIKQRSFIGDDCFIGSNSNIIAPIVVENKSFICAGTTVTENVKTDSFVIGRVRQEIKENRAHRYLKNKESKGE